MSEQGVAVSPAQRKIWPYLVGGGAVLLLGAISAPFTVKALGAGVLNWGYVLGYISIRVFLTSLVAWLIVHFALTHRKAPVVYFLVLLVLAAAPVLIAVSVARTAMTSDSSAGKAQLQTGGPGLAPNPQ